MLKVLSPGVLDIEDNPPNQRQLFSTKTGPESNTDDIQVHHGCDYILHSIHEVRQLRENDPLCHEP